MKKAFASNKALKNYFKAASTVDCTTLCGPQFERRGSKQALLAEVLPGSPLPSMASTQIPSPAFRPLWQPVLTSQLRVGGDRSSSCAPGTEMVIWAFGNIEVFS